MKTEKYFNIAGPCRSADHYMLPAQERCQGVLRLISRKQYFIIHAARQSGKTTMLLDLTRQLNESGEYHAMYCSLETVQGIIEAEKGLPVIVKVLAAQFKLDSNLCEYPFAENADYSDYTSVLLQSLSLFCRQLDKPLVILFDEVDCLTGGTMITFLRQLRLGYVTREQTPFPHAMALVGMRNIRDYKAEVRSEHNTLGSASPFQNLYPAKFYRGGGCRAVRSAHGANRTGFFPASG